MAILEVNENQKQMLLNHLGNLLSDLQSKGPYGHWEGSKTWKASPLELDRIKNLEDIRDLMNQMKGAG